MASRTIERSAVYRPARWLPVAGAVTLVALPLFAAIRASAQQTPATSAQPTFSQSLFAGRRDAKARMLVQADELIYDQKENLVSAVGNVQLYYDGSVLEAAKVTYDRKANKVYAEGNVRYRTKEKQLIHAELLEFTDDFRDGFVKSLLVETPEKTRFAAARADRSEGRLTVYRSGIYTACEPCKDDPSKPLVWQVKAVRIIHDETERMIHYENMQMEFLGIPVMWLPYFSHPDPTVRRKSGFLMPHIYSSTRLGYGLEVPYFWALAPNYDATVSVTPLTRQGALTKGEWRHRLMDGSYVIRGAGIFQLDKHAFDLNPGVPSPASRNFRGVLETAGLFYINSQWAWGWDAALLSDRLFLNDYSFQRGLNERVHQIYMVGQGDRSYFSMRGMAFTGLSLVDRNDEQPFVHPVLDYSYVFGKPVVGGELSYRVNVTSISRRIADFDPINTTALQTGICDSRSLLFSASPANCLLRGVPGQYTRLSAELTWRRTTTTNWGIMFTPFMVSRVDVAYRNVAADPFVGNFIGTSPETLVRAMPAVGVETRWPFIAAHSWGTQVVEPIAQLIARPNETMIRRFPNEDAQSLMFDDTNLFAIDKYSGYDRVEGGVRANVGVQYTLSVNGIGTLNALAGQSYHLFGRNSFAYADTTNIGLQSGLETRVSDYVARLQLVTSRNLTFTTRYRFDKDDFALRRFEAEVATGWGPISASATFGRYDAQPLQGYLQQRIGIAPAVSYRVNSNWTASAAIRYDFNTKKVDTTVLSVNYVDECFTLTAQYVADLINYGTQQPDKRFLLRINLRSLSGNTFSSTAGPT